MTALYLCSLFYVYLLCKNMHCKKLFKYIKKNKVSQSLYHTQTIIDKKYHTQNVIEYLSWGHTIMRVPRVYKDLNPALLVGSYSHLLSHSLRCNPHSLDVYPQNKTGTFHKVHILHCACLLYSQNKMVYLVFSFL